jgi:predicted nucleic acid-binding protein
MRYLLDTGILARLPHRADPLNHVVRQALRALAAQRHTFVTSTQNIAEFWNLCTRPAQARGGFGLGVEETGRRLRMLERFVAVLREPETAYAKWKSIVLKHGVSGKQVHDARIVALMRAYRIRRILTLNDADFARYGGLKVVTPQSIAG